MSELEKKAKTTGQIGADAINLLLCSDEEEKWWVPLEEAQKLETQKNELAKVFHNEVEGGRLLVDKIENLEAKIVDALKILDEYPNSQHEITYWIGRLRKCLANGEK